MLLNVPVTICTLPANLYQSLNLLPGNPRVLKSAKLSFFGKKYFGGGSGVHFEWSDIAYPNFDHKHCMGLPLLLTYLYSYTRR